MNAGTLTQALTASRYKANPTAGSREKQDDTVRHIRSPLLLVFLTQSHSTIQGRFNTRDNLLLSKLFHTYKMVLSTHGML